MQYLDFGNKVFGIYQPRPLILIINFVFLINNFKYAAIT